jgi:hypothetical protein
VPAILLQVNLDSHRLRANKSYFMIVLISLCVAVIAAVVLYYMRLFDCLVRWEYQHHREKWERDGKPDGFFWRGKECVPLSSGIAKKRLDVLWLFKTPDWAAQTPQCRRWLLQKRIISITITFVVLVLLTRLLFSVVH